MTTSLLKKCAFIAAGVCLIAATAHVAGQAPAAPAGAQAPAGGRAGGRGGGNPAPPQGGTGPVKVMVITKGHDFSPRERFFAMFDAMGSDITWTHAEHPAADVMMSPKYGSAYDAFVFYDRHSGTAGGIDSEHPDAQQLVIGSNGADTISQMANQSGRRKCSRPYAGTRQRRWRKRKQFTSS